MDMRIRLGDLRRVIREELLEGDIDEAGGFRQRLGAAALGLGLAAGPIVPGEAQAQQPLSQTQPSRPPKAAVPEEYKNDLRAMKYFEMGWTLGPGKEAHAKYAELFGHNDKGAARAFQRGVGAKAKFKH